MKRRRSECSSAGVLYGTETSRGGGGRSGHHGGGFVGMDDTFVFTMDTPVDL